MLACRQATDANIYGVLCDPYQQQNYLKKFAEAIDLVEGKTEIAKASSSDGRSFSFAKTGVIFYRSIDDDKRASNPYLQENRIV